MIIEPKPGLRRLQRGFSIPELIVAVVVVDTLAATATMGAAYVVRANNAANIASQAVNGYDTLNNYAASHIDALINGGAVTGVGNPMAPTPAELNALGYTAFSTASTVSGATWTYTLAKAPTGCAPNTCISPSTTA